MTGGDALQAIVSAYRRSLTLANGPAVDFGRDNVSQGDGGHGKHGTTTVAPTYGSEAPLSVWIESALVRLAVVVERKVEEAERAAGRPIPGDRRSSAYGAAVRSILDSEGDPTEVAYLHGRTTEGIRKLRVRNGLDPDTGERVRRERPVTAPAREQLLHHESATTTEDPPA